MGAKKNLVYFDLETQRGKNDVGGWQNARMMGMSIGVTYSTQRGGYRIYTENEVGELLTELQRADCVVGFNTHGFDFKVLSAYSVFDLSQIASLDLIESVRQTLGKPIGLDALAQETLGIGKTGDGMDALRWWKEGKLAQIAEYCCYDVKVTRLLHEYGVAYGKVFYKNNITHKREPVAVQWLKDK